LTHLPSLLPQTLTRCTRTLQPSAPNHSLSLFLAFQLPGHPIQHRETSSPCRKPLGASSCFECTHSAPYEGGERPSDISRTLQLRHKTDRRRCSDHPPVRKAPPGLAGRTEHSLRSDTSRTPLRCCYSGTRRLFSSERKGCTSHAVAELSITHRSCF